MTDRSLRGARSARAGLFRRVGLRSAAIGVVLGVALVAGIATPAAATDYPTWQDLQAAKANTAAGQAAVANIQSLISGLSTKAADAQAVADKRGAELEEAQTRYDEASQRADAIQAQAEASKKDAEAATKQAGQLAAQLYRTGTGDLSANLVFQDDKSGGAEALLSKLGNMSKLVERSSDIYASAETAANTAASLGEQAKVAKDEREKLKGEAEDALAAAVSAQQAAADALAESQAKGIELNAQLAFLQDTQAKVATDYEAGVKERARLAAIEAARKAAEAKAAAEAAAAAAKAQAAAAAAAAAAGGGGGGAAAPSQPVGTQGSGGWVKPAYGRITGGFGPRAVICANGCSSPYHYGTDLGTGCSAPIYAAHSGKVVYAGGMGTLGNYIHIDNGDGQGTGYGHIRPGGIFVGIGARVSAGQLIGSTGETGAATACHLHFEVYQNGAKINAVPFMAARGIRLG